jgi:peptidoglycan/LPS O-acetylase OafA/YrhL
MTGGSYEEQFLPHLFVHTWTLGVEMQYYLIWGAIFFAFLVVYKRVADKIENLNRFVYGMNRTLIPQKTLMLLICIGISAFSYVRMQLHFVAMEDPSPIYYAT